MKPPEPSDPHVLVGVELPGDEMGLREMAVAFAEEFAQLGLSRRQILALFHSPFYAGAHRAFVALGDTEVTRLVDETLEVWGRFSCVVEDAAPDRDDRRPVRPNGALRMLR